MNVVHVFPYSARVSGGHSNAIHSFIACQRAKGINSVGIAPLAEDSPAEKDWGFPLAEVCSLWHLRWKILAEKFGINAGDSLLNFHSINHRFAPLMRDLRRTGVPYVLSEQGQLSFQSPARWFKKFVYLNCLDRGPRKAAGLHVLSKIVGARLRFLVAGYHGKILVQGNLVSPPNPSQSRIVHRSDYGIPDDAFVFLFLGRLDVWTKGLDRVVEAFSRLPHARFRLVMAGPDWQGGQGKLERLADQLGCRRRVHFVGPVYGDRKWSVFRMADVFVSPSRKEAFSIALVEAMSCGLTILTSTKITLARELKEADAALLVPPAAAPLAEGMALLERDSQLREGLARRSKAWVQMTCDADRAGVRFRDFYQSILETH